VAVVAEVGASPPALFIRQEQKEVEAVVKEDGTGLVAYCLVPRQAKVTLAVVAVVVPTDSQALLEVPAL
jgi:hypothetical protein